MNEMKAKSQSDKVLMPGVFVGHYPPVKIIGDFLKRCGFRVVNDDKTTQKAVTLASMHASSEFCLPLRVYVGKYLELVENNPDAEWAVVPNLWAIRRGASACSKYRDVSGVVVRNAQGSLAHLFQQASSREQKHLADGLESTRWEKIKSRADAFPRVASPFVRSLHNTDLFNCCLDLYVQLKGLPPFYLYSQFLPMMLRERMFPGLEKIKDHFIRAYEDHQSDTKRRYDELLSDPTRVRLGIVGRDYLIEDPLVTANLKPYFEKKGTAIFTPSSVPFSLLEKRYWDVDGFYHSHKMAEAFVRQTFDLMDGYILAGSFGCHPDAFLLEYLADRLRRAGKPTWVFKYDELAASTGFETRYETVWAFLEEKKDRRLGGREGSQEGAAIAEDPAYGEKTQRRRGDDKPRAPLITWPYMGEILNLALQELFHQLGLSDYVFTPAPLEQRIIEKGDSLFGESCSPYACSTGSIIDSLQKMLNEIDAPRRIIVVMAKGEGPCTFGWYAKAQQKYLPSIFADRLDRAGHTLEFTTMGLDGVGSFLQDLSDLGAREGLGAVGEFLEKRQRGQRVPVRVWAQMAKVLGQTLYPAWRKLKIAEELRAKSLKRRPHEKRAGQTTTWYREALSSLADAHRVDDMERIRRAYASRLADMEWDESSKPAVLVVGEIYVNLTSFANRGVVNYLLGKHGIEALEAVTISDFIADSLQEMIRRWTRDWPVIRTMADWLEKRNVYILQQRVRDPLASPFAEREIGGDGIKTVGAVHRAAGAREAQGILHLYPFKCMPEGIAKDAVAEIADLYGLNYLTLDFDREADIERLKTEVETFASLLHQRHREKDQASSSKRGLFETLCQN